MNSRNGGGNWIETRDLVPRWSIGLSGIACLAVLLVAIFAIWWIFFSNAGIFKLYTPLLGFSLVIWTLLIILWQVELFDFWPFRRSFLDNASPLAKGAALTATTLAVYLVLIMGVVFLLIGNLGVTYFNWHSLTRFGEFGQDLVGARERASWAMLSLSVPFFLISTWFMFGIGKDLFPELNQPRRGIAMWSMIAVISVILYAIFFHPHIGSMFHPQQIYTAVPPWWQDIAHTRSAEFFLGIMFCSVVGVFLTIHLWDGWPFNAVSRQPWRFIFVALGSLVLGYAIFRLQLYIFDYLWYEAYTGGQNKDNFGWRYGHTVTMANFVLVMAIVQNLFFGQAYARFSALVRGILKTVVAIVAGLLFAWVYYTWGPVLLGVVPGVSHPSENAAAFLIFVINLLLIQDFFMDRWPGYKKK